MTKSDGSEMMDIYGSCLLWFVQSAGRRYRKIQYCTGIHMSTFSFDMSIFGWCLIKATNNTPLLRVSSYHHKVRSN